MFLTSVLRGGTAAVAAAATGIQQQKTMGSSHEDGAAAVGSVQCSSRKEELLGVSTLLKDLSGLKINSFFEYGPAAPVRSIAAGRINSKIKDSMYAVTLENIHLSPIIEVGSRVYVEYGRDETHMGIVQGGIVVRVNGSGTVGVMLDNNSFDLAVPVEMIVMSEGRGKYVRDEDYLRTVEWIRTSGVARRIHQEVMACVLFQRGWRVDRLYLLEGSDVHCMTFIPKSVRMCVLDKSEWQRDHHRQMRQLLKERVKERDFRYRLTKYSGVVSASMALLGISFAFGWNVKNYRRQQRSYQLSLAVKTLTQLHNQTMEESEAPLQGRHFVDRSREETAAQQVLQQLDTAHPRIIVFTGYFGCGKSTVCRAAFVGERLPALYVDIRSNEDTLRSIVKALGVQNSDVCGDLLDFVAETCLTFRKQCDGASPLLVLKLREGSTLKRVYNEAVALACDRRVCHLVMEMPVESLTMANVSLPRLDFYMIPNFTPLQAFQYTQNTIDPVSLVQFIETVGTNSNDLDELFAAVHQRRVSPTEYTNAKLAKAMRLLHSASISRPHLRMALRQLAAFSFEEGQHMGVDAGSLGSAALQDVVLYDPVKDVWKFKNKLFHSAARACWS